MSTVRPGNEGTRSAGIPLALPPHDKRRATLQTVVVPRPTDEAAVRVFLICESGPFSDALSSVLRRIDPGCKIELRTQLDGRSPGGAAPSLVLIDLDAALGESELLVQQARRRYPHAAIVAASSALDHAAIDRALEAGATGYLPKNYSEALVEGVLRLVIGGEGYRPQGRRAAAAQRGRPAGRGAGSPPAQGNEYGLTPREVEVLAQIAHGCSNLEVGIRLGLEEATVKRHAYNIFGKLNVNNRAAAALVGARLAAVQREQMNEAEQGRLNLSWLRLEMTHRRMRAGQTIFRAGDVGNTLYTLQRGSVRLPEIDTTIQPGEVFGEIGIFTPEHKRTCSAVCETDVDLFSLTSEQVRRIYFANPQFAFFILHLIATRLMADRQRATR